MVAALIDSLESHGLLDNTYVIYTSDNGFHISTFRAVCTSNHVFFANFWLNQVTTAWWRGRGVDMRLISMYRC